MVDITFINLPSPYLENSNWIPPIGYMQLITMVKEMGFSVDVLDLANLTCEDGDIDNQIIKNIKGINSPRIGVSAVSPQSRFLSLIPLVHPDKYTVAGGSHPTNCPEDVLSIGYSGVVVGEGENCVEDMMRCKTGKLWSEDSFLLDDLPFPDRSLFPKYDGPVPVMAGRGCPFKCVFCAGSKDYRSRTPEDVVLEIMGIESDDIIFYDDTFTMNGDWLEDFRLLIKEAGIKKRFRCSTRADKLTREKAQLLKEIGFKEVCVGVESGSQEILDIVSKKETVQQNSLARKICKEEGLKFKAYIMLGLPGENHETVRETYVWIGIYRPDSIGLYMFNPLPGCDVYECPEKYDITFRKNCYADAFYGGKRESMVCKVRTRALTQKQITEYYWRFLQDFKTIME
ncbi:MAG: B12-binding domain-containing radical SAM protein [bacterium]|nr:B12-binding domain-containing radical SAM protein [bacterium]